MGIESHLIENMMKFPLLVLLSASAVLCEWTCEDCAQASAAVTDIITSPEAYAFDTEILVAEMCPGYEHPHVCEEGLPPLFMAIADIVFPEHMKYICDDMEECKHPPPPSFLQKKASIPSCTECFERIDAVMGALLWEETTQAWIEAFEAFHFCHSYAPGEEAQCRAGMHAIFHTGFPILSEQPKDWLADFCTSWGCQEA